MRDLTPQFAASLQGGATTLCHCWRLIPRQGAPLGFTDHDADIEFGGTVFSAAAGLEAGALEAKLGFAVGGGEVNGALASAALSESDLAGGRFDSASLEIWRVDWSNPDARLLLDLAVIGEVRRSEFAFTAEARSIAHQFDEPVGRLYQAGCAADLGDARCGVDLSAAALRYAGPATATDGRLEFTAAASGFAEGWFTGGSVEFVSGANAGSRAMIKAHRNHTAGAVISLWASPAAPIAPGDSIVLTAGCDKAFATCRSKFANQINFRGFPHMPGNDIVMSYPNAADVKMDGGSLFQ